MVEYAPSLIAKEKEKTHIYIFMQAIFLKEKEDWKWLLYFISDLETFLNRFYEI
jgi:hypothetical protein